MELDSTPKKQLFIRRLSLFPFTSSIEFSLGASHRTSLTPCGNRGFNVHCANNGYAMQLI